MLIWFTFCFFGWKRMENPHGSQVNYLTSFLNVWSLYCRFIVLLAVSATKTSLFSIWCDINLTTRVSMSMFKIKRPCSTFQMIAECKKWWFWSLDHWFVGEPDYTQVCPRFLDHCTMPQRLRVISSLNFGLLNLRSIYYRTILTWTIELNHGTLQHSTLG